MVLDTRVSYPHARTYLLKLHVDADPGHGLVTGRLEHLQSGRLLHFTTLEELVACLAQVLAKG